MKILLIFTLSLVSGPVGCAVTGYLGGSIVIISNQKWNSQNRFFCRKEGMFCRKIINSRTSENTVRFGRFLIYKNSGGFLAVLIRRLTLQDAGTYRMGVGIWTTDVNLKVVNDSCCVEPKSVSGFPGQNINISFNYPEEYQRHYKYMMKLDNYSVLKGVLYTSTQSQNSRFSISEDTSAQVLSISISNVTGDDDGVYLLGIFGKLNMIEFFSFFLEIQLQVQAMTETTPDSKRLNSSSTTTTTTIIIIISVCVCVALLLISGFALLVYKLRHKRTEASIQTPSSKDNEQVPPAACVYEEVNQTKHEFDSDTELYMNTSSPSNSADGKSFTTVQPPPDQTLTYTTLSFQKNPADVDVAVTFSKGTSMTEYATVQHTRLE